MPGLRGQARCCKVPVLRCLCHACASWVRSGLQLPTATDIRDDMKSGVEFATAQAKNIRVNSCPFVVSSALRNDGEAC